MNTPEHTEEGNDFQFAPLYSMQRAGGNGLVNRVVTAWLTSTPARIAALDEALSNDDSERIRRESHALKSSCASIGLMQFSLFARQLEEQARQGPILAASEQRDRLNQLYARALSLIESIAAHGLHHRDTNAVFSDD